MYTLHDITLLNMKQVMEDYIREEEANVTRQGHYNFFYNRISTMLSGIPIEYPKETQGGTFMIV
jgi:hypothetical protein